MHMGNVNNKQSILAKLDAMLISRKESSPEKSYVASLYNKGNEYINRKVLEEANELIEAVNKKDKNHIIHEAADLWFHSLVSLSFLINTTSPVVGCSNPLGISNSSGSLISCPIKNLIGI